MTDASLPQTELEPIYRRNFFILAIDGVLFMVAMAIIDGNTVIPDFVRHLTNSEVLIGLSSSLFGIGWTLPQLFIARYIVRAANKKWWFVGPNIPVRLVMLVFAILVVLIGKEQSAVMLAAFLICYAIVGFGDGIVGVPWADLMGTSLNERWRARMFGWMTAIAAMIMLGVSVIIGNVLGNPELEFPNNYALLFGAAGILFAISILPGIFFHELPGGKAVDKLPSLREFLPQLWHILRTDDPFRAIVIARMLTSLFAMAGPFYIGFATKQLGLSSQEAVPILLAMQTIGTILGAVTYTRLGAKDNVLYIRIVLACGVLLPVSALLAAVVGPIPLFFGFFVSGLALSNLFFGYQNWVVGYATPDQRPIYAGLFNTVAALISVTAPFIAGTIIEKIGFEALFAVSIVMGLAALFVMMRYIRRPRVETPVALAAAD